MADKIEPALSAEEWATLQHLELVDWRTIGQDLGLIRGTPAGAIALANAALPDSDSRKITREKLRYIRQLMGAHEDDEKEFLDALESYLPPVE